jgi:hypothetical protein
MSPTELQLFVKHRSTVVRLEAICEEYFGLGAKTASDYAALNKLPVPAFRLTSSQKAPWMVKLSALAAHIDAAQKAAQELWEKSWL